MTCRRSWAARASTYSSPWPPVGTARPSHTPAGLPPSARVPRLGLNVCVWAPACTRVRVYACMRGLAAEGSVAMGRPEVRLGPSGGCRASVSGPAAEAAGEEVTLTAAPLGLTVSCECERAGLFVLEVTLPLYPEDQPDQVRPRTQRHARTHGHTEVHRMRTDPHTQRGGGLRPVAPPSGPAANSRLARRTSASGWPATAAPWDWASRLPTRSWSRGRRRPRACPPGPWWRWWGRPACWPRCCSGPGPPDLGAGRDCRATPRWWPAETRTAVPAPPDRRRTPPPNAQPSTYVAHKCRSLVVHGARGAPGRHPLKHIATIAI
jgi:hypothetical protein